MSQSDYIKHLKLASELKNQSDFNQVLDSRDYTLFKGYTIANTVKNTVQLYEQLPLPGITEVFNVQLTNVENCPKFTSCINTNQRGYRVPLSQVYFTPHIVPRYVKHPVNTQCSACCYDTSVNGANKTKGNFFNTNFTSCLNYRLRKMKCNCKTF